ncbi:hypothetical protein [Leucothrix arctica]|uniref:DUF4013 domain-containing protein n=1 Tax=Leucothrix arctica TaxID=1481894 RepID=A0A317CA04_9GAMM|nr:hypothetical protein [Leucothrix arctica]PWQ95197.1 hypothetical protein DKT75_12675 [Leucothrix arctica]
MLKQSLLDTWNFFKNHAHTLFLIVLPIVIPLQIALAMIFSDPPTSPAGAETVSPEQFAYIFKRIFVEFLFAPVYRIAVIVYLSSVIDGNPLSRMSCWKLGLKYWVPYLALSLIVGFIVSTGMMFLILPGIFFAVRLAFAEFDLLFNNSSPLKAMKTSFAQTAPHFGVILRGYLIIFSVLFMPYYLLSGLVPHAVASVLSILFSVTLYIVMTVFAYRVYDLTKSGQESEPKV